MRLMRLIASSIRQALIAVAVTFAAAPGARAASPAGICPSPGAPAGAHLTWVAPQVAVDGLPMAIVMLQSDKPPSAILDWYAQRWLTQSLQAQTRPVRYTAGAWQVVARRIAGCFETVQTQTAAGGGTLAYIGISRSPGAATQPALGPDIPRPPGAQQLLGMDSLDAARHGQTVLLSVPMPLDAALHYYIRQLAAHGWAVQMAHAPTSSQAGLMAQRHARQIELGLSAVQGKTYALLTLVQN